MLNSGPASLCVCGWEMHRNAAIHGVIMVFHVTILVALYIRARMHSFWPHSCPYFLYDFEGLIVFMFTVLPMSTGSLRCRPPNMKKPKFGQPWSYILIRYKHKSKKDKRNISRQDITMCVHQCAELFF